VSEMPRANALIGNEIQTPTLRSNESLYLTPTRGENIERLARLGRTSQIRRIKNLKLDPDSDNFYLLDNNNTLYKMDTRGDVVWRSLRGIFNDRNGKIRIDKNGRPYAWQRRGLIRLDPDTGDVQLLFGNENTDVGRPYVTFSTANDGNEGLFAFRPSPHIVLGLDNTETYIRTWETEKEYEFTDIVRRDRLKVQDENGFTTNVRSWSITNDGTTILVHGYSDNQIAQYTLSDPFEVSTASHDVTLTEPFGIDSNGNPREFIIGAEIRNNGQLLFIHVRNEDNNTYKLYKFDLDTPYDIQSATNKVSNTFNSPDAGRDKSTVTRDGKYIYYHDNNDFNNDVDGARIKLDTPFDITGGFTKEATGQFDISLPNTLRGVRFWCRGERDITYIAEDSISSTRYDAESPTKRSNIEQITTDSKGNYYLALRTFNEVTNYVINGETLKNESYNLIKVDENFSNAEFVFRGGSANDIGRNERDRHRFNQLDILPNYDDILLVDDKDGRERLYELRSDTTTRSDKEIRNSNFDADEERYDVGYHPELDEPVWVVADNASFIRVYVGLDGIRDINQYTTLEFPRNRGGGNNEVEQLRIDPYGNVVVRADRSEPLEAVWLYDWVDDPRRYAPPVITTELADHNDLDNIVITKGRELIADSERQRTLLKTPIGDSTPVYQVKNLHPDGARIDVSNERVSAEEFKVKAPARIRVNSRCPLEIVRIQ
jgi:hypothetical protein